MANRSKGLDALRAVAALSVVSFHYNVQATQVADHDAALFRGFLGVELFFIISGFVILMTVERTPSVASFFGSRASRLFPAYWLAVAVAVAFSAIGLTTAVPWATGAVNMTMLQHFVGVADISTPFWTLAYEVLFYFGIGAVFAAGLLPRIAWISLAWLAVAAAARWTHWATIFDPASFWLALRFGELFIAGMMIYRIGTKRGDAATWAALIGANAYALFGRDDWAWTAGWAYAPAILVFSIMVSLARNPVVNRYVPNWFAGIGRASYSLYLLHDPVGLLIAAAFLQFGLSRAAAYWAALPVALVVARLSYRWIEQPGQRLLTAHGSVVHGSGVGAH